MESLKDQLGYPEDLFEVYMDHAAAEGDATTLPDSAELIRGLERLDMAGHGGDFVSQKVLAETTIIYNALQAARVPASTLVVFPKNVASQHKNSLAPGWAITALKSAPSSLDGGLTTEHNPRVLLSQDGDLYVYRPALEKPADDPVDGLVFNRYAPVCCTRINDRSILYGFARLVGQLTLDTHPQPASV